jgi:hypothetical protein
VVEVKSVTENKNPSSCDVLILVCLMALSLLYRLVLLSVRLNGKTFEWCVGKEVEEGFRGPVDCRPKYRVIQNDCWRFNNLSYTIHLRYDYIVVPMDQEILKVFFYDVRCAVVMHFSAWSAVY